MYIRDIVKMENYLALCVTRFMSMVNQLKWSLITIINVAKKKLYQECRRCKTKLPSLKALADHCKLHHPDQNCEMCGAHFAIYEHLEQHKRDVHNA